MLGKGTYLLTQAETQALFLANPEIQRGQLRVLSTTAP